MQGPDPLGIMKKSHRLTGRRGPMLLTKSHLHPFSIKNSVQFHIGWYRSAHVLKSLEQYYFCVPTRLWIFFTSGPNYLYVLVLQMAWDFSR